MKPSSRRWLKRAFAVIGSSAIILVGIVLMMVSLQHHFGSDLFETRHTDFYLVFLSACVIAVGVFLLVQFNKEPDISEAGFPGMRVNVLCLMGAVLAFFCMVELNWASGSYATLAGRHPDLFIQIDWAIWPPIEYFQTGEVYAWFFVVGAVLAFFTPLAGFIQLSGVTIFALKLNDILSGPAGAGSWGAFGFVVAIVAASMTLLSLAHPYGVGYKRETIDLPGRILTVSSSELAEKIARWRHHRPSIPSKH